MLRLGSVIKILVGAAIIALSILAITIIFDAQQEPQAVAESETDDIAHGGHGGHEGRHGHHRHRGHHSHHGHHRHDHDRGRDWHRGERYWHNDGWQYGYRQGWYNQNYNGYPYYYYSPDYYYYGSPYYNSTPSTQTYQQSQSYYYTQPYYNVQQQHSQGMENRSQQPINSSGQ